MVQEIPIICQRCRKTSGYTNEEVRHLVLQSDLKCKKCGEVVISARSLSHKDKPKEISWKEKEKRREYWWEVNP